MEGTFTVHLADATTVDAPTEYEGSMEDVQAFLEAWMQDHLGQAVVIVPCPLAA